MADDIWVLDCRAYDMEHHYASFYPATCIALEGEHARTARATRKG